MDQYLIAPDLDLIWRFSPALDRRRSPGEAELVRLASEPVLAPKEIAYSPSREALEWRVGGLKV